MDKEKVFPRETWDMLQDDVGMQLTEDYSGRFMMGEKCPGVIGTMADLVQFLVAMAWVHTHLDDPDAWASDLAVSARSDNMGMATIWYWPGWSVGK